NWDTLPETNGTKLGQRPHGALREVPLWPHHEGNAVDPTRRDLVHEAPSQRWFRPFAPLPACLLVQSQASGAHLRTVEGRNAFDRERAPALAGRLERITVNLPAGFDPRRHTPAVIQKITESHGPGWEVEAIDPSGKRLRPCARWRSPRHTMRMPTP